MHISHLRIQNFRNFAEFEIELWKNVVVVGENNVGKSNLLHALRLVLDPTLPNSARNLEATDFWDGLKKPFAGSEIRITVTFSEFEAQEPEHAAVPKCFANDGKTASITYVYGPMRNRDFSTLDQLTEDEYEWYFWCENTQAELKDTSFQKFLPFEVLPALRNVSADLENSQRSPLNRLIRRLKVDEAQLRDLSEEIDDLMSKVRDLPPIPDLQKKITDRLLQMIGSVEAIDPTLGILSSDPNRLLRYIRLFADSTLARYISDIGTGYANIVYIILLLLDLKQREEAHPNEERRATTIIAVEEPEAHLHPHLQRLVFSDLFREAEGKIPVFLTTHSPHIVSVSPLKSLLLLKRSPHGTVGTNMLDAGLTEREVDDIQRYLDVTRAELVFSSGVILVEGIAEVYLVTEFARLLNPRKSLDILGISVINVYSTDFAPYLKLLGKNGLNIRTAVITDGDPKIENSNQRCYGIERCLDLLTMLNPATHLTVNDDINLPFVRHGLFVGTHTLEIDLLEAGYQDEILEIFREFGEGPQSIQNTRDVFAQWSTLSPDEKKTKFIDKIERVAGKGRFAQRFMSKLDPDRIPPYISQALRYMGIERDEDSSTAN